MAEENPQAEAPETNAPIYPQIDVEAWLDLPEDEWMSVAFVQLATLYQVVDKTIAETTEALGLPCHRGCDACCHNSVFLTPLEFAYAWHWAQDNLDAATRDAIIDKALALFHANRGLIEALEEPPPGGEQDHYELVKELNYRCPILGDDGACQIYPARELLSRLFGASFNAQGGMYGCKLVQAHMEGQEATLLTAQTTAQKLRQLPMTHKRQVYPYYFYQLYGEIADTTSATETLGTPKEERY